MSVSFYVESSDHDPYYFTCPCGLWKSEVYSDYFKASAARPNLKSECKDSDCQYDSAHYGLSARSIYDPIEVNVSNVNASVLLSRLGIESPELIGELDGDKFVAACLVGQTKLSTNDYGYVSGRIAGLFALGAAAAAIGRKVMWS